MKKLLKFLWILLNGNWLRYQYCRAVQICHEEAYKRMVADMQKNIIDFNKSHEDVNDEYSE